MTPHNPPPRSKLREDLISERRRDERSGRGGGCYAPDAPFGGCRQSGIGREMGVAGLEEFLERKTLATVVS
jgi:Aldehyde dehydrogenase family